MTVALPSPPPPLAEAAFDLSRPSPLPPPTPADPALSDRLFDTERSVARSDLAGSPDERVRARVALADRWLERHAVGPAIDVLRAAEKLQPGHPAVTAGLARALPRAALLREAALARRSLAQAHPDAATGFDCAAAWLRADDHAEAARAVEALTLVAPDDPRTGALTVTFARLRSASSGDAFLVATLIECAARARRLDDPERWREHALDAWFESRGAEGGETLSEALAAAGHPRAAVYVAAETAARALAGDLADLATAARVLERCARLAESAGLPSEATAAWTVRALLPDEGQRAAREALRDLLSERGRALDLAARLRADARRAAPESRAAAWKGVAAAEIGPHPTSAAFALAEGVRHQPDDAEALELLAVIAEDPALGLAVRDALWVIVRAPSGARGSRTRVLLWLASLEEAAGDHAAAAAALAGVEDPPPEVLDALARVRPEAEAQAERARAALEAIAAADADAREALCDRFLTDFADAPGALRDARLNARVLGPRAARDERAGTLWVRAARRSDDPAQLPNALRRLATRAEDPAVRASAALAAAEELDQLGETASAAELLTLVLDEVPGDAALAAALAALAEHAGDRGLGIDALRAVARAATDPWERDFLRRFTGERAGTFAAFASSLSAPAPSQQRCDDLAVVHDLVGDATSILAARTRALLAMGGPMASALAVSERFAAFAPHSPEATIAWFGAANVAGEPAAIAAAAVAVARSLAGVRDVSAVTRSALARLEAVGEFAAARQVALEAATAVGLGDRALRAAVMESIRRHPEAPQAAPLLEHCAAIVGAVEEQREALALLVGHYARSGEVALEIAALWRRRPHAREAADARLAALLPRVGDRARYARLLADQLAAVLRPEERRARLLTMAAEYAAAQPPRPSDALECIDRIAQEGADAETQGLVTRACLALGQPEAAVGRLLRWAAESAADEDAAVRMRCAAQVARDALRAPGRALVTLRTLLRRVPGDAAALTLAEDVAVESGAIDAILAIYQDLTAAAAGEHGRHALAYRRAVLLERVGRTAEALAEQFALFLEAPSLGASFSAVERLAERAGEWEVLARALGLLALHATTAETRGRYFAAASEVARERCGDPRLGLFLECHAYLAAHSHVVAASLRRHLRALRSRDPAVARVTAEVLVDDALQAARQTWDDATRRAHALDALEVCLHELDDPRRAQEATELSLQHHGDPLAARRAVTVLLDGTSPAEPVRAAIRAALERASASAPARAGDGDFFLSLDLNETTPARGPAPETTPAPAALPGIAVEPDSDGAEITFSDGLIDPNDLVDGATAAASLTAPGTVKLGLASLRAAMAQGDDDAAAALAAELADAPETRDESLMIQRRRFDADPTRLDALEGIGEIYAALRMRAETAALASVHTVLSGHPAGHWPEAPALAELADPLDGIARVLMPAHLDPFAELGALVWEALLGARGSAPRLAFAPDRDPPVQHEFGRTFAAAVRLLQLPKATTYALRADLPDGMEITTATSPPTLQVAASLARDAPRARFWLGHTLEATRPNHLPLTAGLEDGEPLVAAIVAAFGRSSPGRLDPEVGRIAARLYEGISPRSLRRLQDLVEALGPRLTWPRWHEAVSTARDHAGMLICGDFRAAAGAVLEDAPPEVSRDPAVAIASWERLRALARFAISEEYLLLRWQRLRVDRW